MTGKSLYIPVRDNKKEKLSQFVFYSVYLRGTLIFETPTNSFGVTSSTFRTFQNENTPESSVTDQVHFKRVREPDLEVRVENGSHPVHPLTKGSKQTDPVGFFVTK